MLSVETAEEDYKNTWKIIHGKGESDEWTRKNRKKKLDV
jgi:hypothetical protein